MTVDFSTVAAPPVRTLRPYEPGRGLDLPLVGDLVQLCSNENPLGPSPNAIAAARAAIVGCGRYPDRDCSQLKKALSSHLGVQQTRISVGNGSNDIIETLARAFLAPGTEAVVSQYAFAIYALVSAAAGATVVTVPARDYEHDLEAMADATNARTRIVFIANPNNPTGGFIDESRLVALLESVPPDVIVLVDEAYVDFVAVDAYPRCLKLQERFSNLVVTRTFSKAFGLAGLRVGYSISVPAITHLVDRVRQPFAVNAVAQAAAMASLTDAEHLRRSVTMNAEGLKFITRSFDDMGLRYLPSVANFIALNVGRGAAEFLYRSLLAQRVLVRRLGPYGLPDYLRISTGTAEENARFVAALRTSMATLHRL
jgi:histidinol-phosphate aminotransferase